MTRGRYVRATAAAVRAVEDLADAREAFAEAGEEAAEFARLLAGILAACEESGRDEVPLEEAVRAGVAVERLRGGGVGLDHVLEVALAAARGFERFSPGELGERLSRALALVLTRSYLDAESAEQREAQKQLRALVGISRAVNRTLDPGLVAHAGLNETLRAMGLDAGAIWLGQEAGLSLAHTFGVPEAVRDHLLRIDVGAAPAVRSVLRTRTPAAITVPGDDPALGAYRSVMLVPLIGAHHRLGLLAVGSHRARTFDTADLSFLGAVAEHLTAALDHAFEHRRQAYTDYLTGLSNRAEFEAAVRRELAAVHRHRRPFSLMLVDLDHLKQVNDRFGHHAGDEAIRTVAIVIRRAVRTSDVCARLGGDEFAVAMPEAGLGQAREVASRIQQALKGETLGSAPGQSLELSFGISQWEPGQDYAALFRSADRLLYRDKRRHHARRAAAETLPVSTASSDPTSSPATP